MIRHASQWITNVKLGGRPLAVVPDQTMKEIAVRAAAAVGADFAGVDILHDADGRPTVLEVNSMPAWSGLQKVTSIDIASTLATDLMAAFRTPKRQGARSVTRATQIADDFRNACLDELDAPKPGNVHSFAAGHRMTASDFIRSADAAAVPLARTGARVGERILVAVEATFAVVGMNTNLGIILLCAPLAAAAERQGAELRAAVTDVLATLDVEDADSAFRAIARASPAGLGRVAQHDVSAPATITLKQAMAEAKDRDRIARQYVSDFADVFELGEPTLAGMLSQAEDPRWATLAVYLALLVRVSRQPRRAQTWHCRREEIRQTASTFAKKFARLTRPTRCLRNFLHGMPPSRRATSIPAPVRTDRRNSVRPTTPNILPPHSNSD